MQGQERRPVRRSMNAAGKAAGKAAGHEVRVGPVIDAVGHLHNAYQWAADMDRVLNPLVHSLEGLIALARGSPRFRIHALLLEAAGVVRSPTLTKETYLSTAYRLPAKGRSSTQRAAVDSMALMSVKGRVAEITGVYTRASRRRRGLAKRTVRALLKIAEGLGPRLGSVQLEVNTRCASAVALYTGLGFSMIGKTVTQPDTRETFHVMVRQLP